MSQVCHHIGEWRGEQSVPCGKPAVYRYPAMGGGFAYLCHAHGEKHGDYSEHITAGFGRHVREPWEPWGEPV